MWSVCFTIITNFILILLNQLNNRPLISLIWKRRRKSEVRIKTKVTPQLDELIFLDTEGDAIKAGFCDII